MKKIKNLRLIIVAFTVFLILGMAFQGGTHSTAEASESTPTWSEGDQWNYERNTSDSEYPYVFSITVNSTSASMDGYDCYKVTQQSDIVVNWHEYVTKDGLELVKTENTDAYNRTYHTPFDRFNFPLEVGDTWQVNVTYTYGDDEYNLKKNYTCLKKETISVPAGDYEAYVIKSYEDSKWVDPETDYKLTYYSPEVKYKVKTVDYSMDQNTGEKKIVSSTNLTSYQEGGEEQNGDDNTGEDGNTSEDDTGDDSIPGFTLPLTMISIATVLIIKEWKNRSSQDKNSKSL
ncbi:MAG: hypothetical protein V5A66_06805 [Candidatus Thermoplasmatota archaeon]